MQTYKFTDDLITISKKRKKSFLLVQYFCKVSFISSILIAYPFYICFFLWYSKAIEEINQLENQVAAPPTETNDEECEQFDIDLEKIAGQLKMEPLSEVCSK